MTGWPLWMMTGGGQAAHWARPAGKRAFAAMILQESPQFSDRW